MINTGAASLASRLYLHDLEHAYQRDREVWDPDYALGVDPDVYEVIGRDPETSHAIQQRRHLVAGSRWRLVPADDDEQSRDAAAIVERILAQIERLGDFGMARFHLADAIFRGSAWAAIEGRVMPLRIGGVVGRWWVPTGLRNVDKRRFRQFVGRDGAVGWELYSIARGRWEPLADRRRWFVRLAYDDSEATLGYGRGLTEALYHAQYAKGKVLTEGLQGLERWAQGIVDAKIDSLRIGSADATNTAVVDATLDTLRKMRSRHEFVHGEDVELQIHETSGGGHDLFERMYSLLTSAIRTLILGANLPTSATSGGSYALAEVQENSTEALVRFDRQLVATAIGRDLIGLCWELNAPQLGALGLAGVEPPTFAIVSQIARDANAATSISTLLNAGVRGLREDEVYEAVGFTPAGPWDRRLEVGPPAGAGVAPGTPLPAAPQPQPEQPAPEPSAT